MSYADDIRRIAKMPKENGGLSAREGRSDIDGNSKPFLSLEETEGGIGIVSPVTFEVLTYDDSLDVTVTTPSGTATIKTAETAQITDAEGTIIYIDEIIYPAVP